jgi:hypothetical protein
MSLPNFFFFFAGVVGMIPILQRYANQNDRANPVWPKLEQHARQRHRKLS